MLGSDVTPASESDVSRGRNSLSQAGVTPEFDFGTSVFISLRPGGQGAMWIKPRAGGGGIRIFVKGPGV